MRKETPKERRQKEFGRLSNASGREGERFAGTILKKAFPVSMRGADFVIPGKVPQYVEVKATFGTRPDKAIILKTRGGKWVNALADHVVIVTNTHVYFADAEALRKHVRDHFKSFEQLPQRRRETITRVNVPVAHLEEHGVAVGVERNSAGRIAELVNKLGARTQIPVYRNAAQFEFALRKPMKSAPFYKKPQYNRRIPPRR